MKGFIILSLFLLISSCGNKDDNNAPINRSPPLSAVISLISTKQTSATFNITYPNQRLSTDYNLVIAGGRQSIEGNQIVAESLSRNTSYQAYVSSTFRDIPEYGITNSDTISFTTLDRCQFNAAIFENVIGEPLKDSLRSCYTPSFIATYADARDYMLTTVDGASNGDLSTIYTDYQITLDGIDTPRQEALALGVNTEHLFPQSMGAGQQPARSDIYNMMPARADVNSYRSNKPFGDIDDTETQRWYWDSSYLTEVPSSNIDWYSEGTGDFFEPREQVKGDVARALMYFMIIHEETANESFFESMKSTLLLWHSQDPVDTNELTRMERIKQLQGNENPFVIDSSLATRLFN